MQLLFTSFKDIETTKKIYQQYGITTLAQALLLDTMLKNKKD